MEKEILTVFNELKSSGVQISYWVYIWIAIISLIFSGLGAYLSTYLRKKGEQTAIMEDLNDIKNQLKHTTETIETVKASISKNLYIKKSKWDFKKSIYYDLIINLTALRTYTLEFKNYPEGSEKKDSSFQKLYETLQTIMKHKEVGGIFIDQPIMDKIFQLGEAFSEKKTIH